MGLVLLAGGLFSLVFALMEGNRRGWSSAFILGLFAAPVVLLASFCVQQLRRRTPLEAGVRFLPISLLAFVAAPIGGKLTFLQNGPAAAG